MYGGNNNDKVPFGPSTITFLNLKCSSDIKVLIQYVNFEKKKHIFLIYVFILKFEISVIREIESKMNFFEYAFLCIF
ncbi:unnamed protein product [Pneumocystis jirovecii]|uniref:Uncharacterized protein n=1 Tax=Pneumocystis jirovecii TaxID=42068 RepID=L0PDJ3_PNEJI|nr:unnamed protein product [Pneumocystis jirovecii]